MRTNNRLPWFVLLLSMVLARPMPAADAAQREVLATLHDWLNALAANDLPRIERIIADDYRITLSDGRVLDKDQDLAPLKSGKLRFTAADAQDVVIRVFGTTAVVTGMGTYTAEVDGKEAHFKERFTDVYVKRKGRWQPVASHSTPIK